jgi:hypothetical protein
MLIPVYCLEHLPAFLGCLTQRNFNQINTAHSETSHPIQRPAKWDTLPTAMEQEKAACIPSAASMTNPT